MHFSIVTARGKSRDGFFISASTVGKAWLPENAKATFKKALVVCEKGELPNARSVTPPSCVCGPAIPREIMTIRSVATMLTVHGHPQ